MGLIGNYSVLNKSCATFTNGTSAAGAYAANTRSNWNKENDQIMQSGFFPARASSPEGYGLGEAYNPPRKSGGIAGYLSGSSSLMASLTMAKVSSAALAGVGSVVSDLKSLASASASISGTGSITAAALATAGASAAISGIGSVVANLSARLPMSCSINGSGGVTSNLRGTGRLEANIVIGGTGYLSNDDVTRLASAVWDESTTYHQESGTTGRALSDAGSAGNPWSANLADNQTEGTFGWFVQKLLTVAKFLGLK